MVCSFVQIGREVKLSVITVCFNSAACIGRTVRSVLLQEDCDFEYIIVDGGSTDGTVDLIRDFAASDPRISWISEPDRGISDAFNKGVVQASGELLGIINADDEYTPGALCAVAREYSVHPECDVFHGNMLRQDGDTPLYVLTPAETDQRIWRQMPLNHPATFVTKRAYEKVGAFDVHLKVAMDYDLVLRLFQAGCRFCYIRKTLAVMRYGGASDDRFIAGLRESMEITSRLGYPRWKARAWFGWKALKGYLKILLRHSGMQAVLKLHPRFRNVEVNKTARKQG